MRRGRSLPRQGGAARGRHRGHLRACPRVCECGKARLSEATVPSQYCTALPAISGIEPVLVAITARPTPRASSSGPFVSPTEPDLRHKTQSAATTASSYVRSSGSGRTSAPRICAYARAPDLRDGRRARPASRGPLTGSERFGNELDVLDHAGNDSDQAVVRPPEGTSGREPGLRHVPRGYRMRDDLEPTRSPCSVHQHVRRPGRVDHRCSGQACDLRIGECAIRGGERARPRDDVVHRDDEGGPWSSRLAEEAARRVREVDVRGPDGIASFDKPVRDVFVGERGRQSRA